MERLRTMASDSELLDIAQAAALLRVSEASLRRWTNGGRLPCRRIGGRRERRFRRADLMAFLEGDAGETPARHVCAFYASDLGRTRQAADLIGKRLDAGSVCILTAQRRARERAHGVPVRRAQPLRPGNGPVSPASSGPVPSPHRPVRELTRLAHFRSYACCSALISIFFICSMACMTRFAFSGSLSPSILPRTVGMICHDRPYLSCSQPH